MSLKKLFITTLVFVTVDVSMAQKTPLDPIDQAASDFIMAHRSRVSSAALPTELQNQIVNLERILQSKRGLGPTQKPKKLLLPLQNPQSKMLLVSGHDIGGGLTSSDFSTTWCRGQISLLETFREKAARRLNRTGSHFEANQVLLRGMTEAALENQKTKDAGFTKRALERGLELGALLGAYNPLTPGLEHQAIHHLLVKYYDFVIKDVAQDLDLGAYLPTLKRWKAGERGVDISTFERQFVGYAARQIEWLNTNLTTVQTIRHRDGSLEAVVVPKGSAKMYTAAVEVISLAAAEDLYESIWANRFACAISKLQSIYILSHDYNSGNRADFGDDREAVSEFFKELNNTKNKITAADSCR